MLTDRPTQTDHRERTPHNASVRATFMGLRLKGFSVQEAGNLTARLEGIGVIDGGWTIQEVQRLLFVRELVTSHRLEG